MSVANTHFGPEGILPLLKQSGTVYFIGVGGVMMSSLARLTKQAGFPVCGSDRSRTAVTESLIRDGIPVFLGHAAKQIPPDTILIVYTVAVSPDNPELLETQRRGIPCVSRADYLGAWMTGYRNRVGISGMHGKSTCTSMCAEIFLRADADPTVISGADYPPMGGAYRIGGREHFLFEACEYMDSFLDFRPTVAVILGEEWEHVDYFRSMEQIRDSFARFASLTGQGGVCIVNADDPDAVASARRAWETGHTGRVITFGLNEANHPDFLARSVHTENGLPVFEWVVGGQSCGTVKLRVSGTFQIYNALSAAAAARVCGIPDRAIREGLTHFSGAARRMEKKGTVNGCPVYDDYGHHPTEVRRTLEGARALLEGGTGETGVSASGRLICVFQPHTYSRTALLYDQFLSAFDSADLVLFPDIFPARETNIYGVSTETLAADLNRLGRTQAVYCPDPAAIADRIRETATERDLVVIMGAGDVTRVTECLLGGKTSV